MLHQDIKFRLWSQALATMSEPMTIEDIVKKSKNQGRLMFIFLKKADRFAHTKDIEWLPWTQRWDCDSKEIYEGMIVKDKQESRHKELKGWKASVQRSPEGFHLSKMHPFDKDFDELASNGRLKIIGTIQQNEELLWT